MHRCKLCDEERELQKSHVIPRFIYKYMLGITNNSLTQFDGQKNLWQKSNRQLKKELFCAECEQLLGKNETTFSLIFKEINSNSNREGLVCGELGSQAIKDIELKGITKQQISTFLENNPLYSQLSNLKYFAISYIYREILNNSYKIPEKEITKLKRFLLKQDDLAFMLHIRLHDSTPSFNLFSTAIVLDGLEDWKHYVFYLPNMQFHVALRVGGTPEHMAKTLIIPSNFFNDELSSIELLRKFQKGVVFQKVC